MPLIAASPVRREPIICTGNSPFLCLSKLPIYTDDRRPYVDLHPADFWRIIESDIYHENMCTFCKVIHPGAMGVRKVCVCVLRLTQVTKSLASRVSRSKSLILAILTSLCITYAKQCIRIETKSRYASWHCSHSIYRSSHDLPLGHC